MPLTPQFLGQSHNESRESDEDGVSRTCRDRREEEVSGKKSRRRKPEMVLTGHIAAISALAFSPDGLMMVSGCAKGWANVWSLQDRCLLHTYTGKARQASRQAGRQAGRFVSMQRR